MMTSDFQNNSSPLVLVISSIFTVLYTQLLYIVSYFIQLFTSWSSLSLRSLHFCMHYLFRHSFLIHFLYMTKPSYVSDLMNLTIFSFSNICSISLLFFILQLPSSNTALCLVFLNCIFNTIIMTFLGKFRVYWHV